MNLRKNPNTFQSDNFLQEAMDDLANDQDFLAKLQTAINLTPIVNYEFFVRRRFEIFPDSEREAFDYLFQLFHRFLESRQYYDFAGGRKGIQQPEVFEIFVGQFGMMLNNALKPSVKEAKLKDKTPVFFRPKDVAEIKEIYQELKPLREYADSKQFARDCEGVKKFFSELLTKLNLCSEKNDTEVLKKLFTVLQQDVTKLLENYKTAQQFSQLQAAWNNVKSFNAQQDVFPQMRMTQFIQIANDFLTALPHQYDELRKNALLNKKA